MKKIGFIGAYDKTDMILYVAKILTVMNNKVLVIDSTIDQKARYIVPAVSPTLSYITTFEDIDVAVGFNSFDDIKEYIGTALELQYDIILVDIDVATKINTFSLETANKNYFVTSFDMYSLKRGVEILNNLKNEIKKNTSSACIE